MARKKPDPVKYSTELILEAACAAYRLNSGYTSVGSYFPDENGDYVRPNKELVRNFLADQSTLAITDADRELAQVVRTYYQSLTLKLITEDRINDFDRTCMEIANAEEVTGWVVGQASYMPHGYEKWRVARTVEDRLYECRADYVAAVGAKVNLSIEVLKVIYSRNFQCYYYTAITKDNFSVFFPSPNPIFEVGANYTVTAKVKDHRQNHQAYLNYVKIA